MLTRSAVQVGEVEDVSSTADGVAGAAEADLTLLKRGSEGRDGESEDGGVKHVDGLGLVVDWLGEELVDCSSSEDVSCCCDVQMLGFCCPLYTFRAVYLAEQVAEQNAMTMNRRKIIVIDGVCSWKIGIIDRDKTTVRAQPFTTQACRIRLGD